MADSVNIGRFDYLVTFQSPITETDLRGSRVRRWQNEGDFFADVEENNADEGVYNNNYASTKTATITTYLVPGIDNSWRVLVGNDVFNILSVNRVRNKPYLQITAEKQEEVL